ncbi:iron-hydroxamate ABC transporter substrate-binding protein [Bacillus sp. FJAT-50079]|uniref:iron-hydroxamate ABC transporter substrate-binding protein n=1 Tax=Bacillus sp. FJAT-50079 TaxID=2833577 RepID=UPI001BCA2A02|nr:iron-hydroxamate ABC transporter substrate-binding protein [Bacillus sp. FJAT-50079]MBS4209318.1 iron-hydroxamate ABC transporter substrate-binding protein [Bacillus sp. FJAT-50079]
MKRLTSIIFIILMIGILAACGKTSDGKDSEEKVAGEVETITYSTVNGDIDIPKNPQRVVVVADSYVGDFLALGIKPIGVTEHAMQNTFFEGLLDGVESIGEDAGVNTEKILELDPDLIIAFNDPETYEQLSKIAPTVAINYGEKDYKEQLLEFGKMTGKEKEAEAWLKNWEEKINEVKPKVQEAVGDKTVAILTPFSKGIYAFGHSFARGGEIIYGEFGLKAPEPIQEAAIDSGQGWAELSLENLPEFAGDYIFTCPWSGDDADPEKVYGSSLWKDLPAVKNGNVFELDRAASYFNDPVSLEKQLDFIVESLTGK